MVTHNQEEAMEVAGRIVLMNHGKIEQVGDPQDLYERPANEFVMGFIGPVNRLGDTFIRPHDIQIRLQEDGSTSEAMVEEVVYLGFEVRVELSLSDGQKVWAQVTRQEAKLLVIERGETVHVCMDHSKVFAEA